MSVQENQMAESHLPESNIFEKLNSYPFDTDLEFAKGLAIILGHTDTPATEAEINRKDDLVLQAKCFYFSRKENLSPPLKFADYKTWLESASATELSSINETTGAVSQQSIAPATSVPPQSEPEHQASTQVQEPAYPSSFAHIVELITTGQPIPGIEQIPDTVLTGHDTSSEKPRRLKPWEKEGETSQT